MFTKRKEKSKTGYFTEKTGYFTEKTDLSNIRKRLVFKKIG